MTIHHHVRGVDLAVVGNYSKVTLPLSLST